MKTIKEGDVYKFMYSEEYRKKLYDSNWCFDGQLVARKYHDGKILLVDTYWGGGSERHYGTYEEWEKKGELTFYVNLTDTEKNTEDCERYYVQEDIFNLSHQHGCYKDIRIRKGAKRNKEVMLETINEKIQQTHRDMESKARTLEMLSATRAKIEAGDLTQYI